MGGFLKAETESKGRKQKKVKRVVFLFFQPKKRKPIFYTEEFFCKATIVQVFSKRNLIKILVFGVF